MDRDDVGDGLAPRRSRWSGARRGRGRPPDAATEGCGPSGRAGRRGPTGSAGRGRRSAWRSRRCSPSRRRARPCRRSPPTDSRMISRASSRSRRGLQAGAAGLGVGVGVARQHLVADEVLDEGERPAGGGVVGVRDPAVTVRRGHHVVLADDGLAHERDQRRGRFRACFQGRAEWCEPPVRGADVRAATADGRADVAAATRHGRRWTWYDGASAHLDPEDRAAGEDLLPGLGEELGLDRLAPAAEGEELHARLVVAVGVLGQPLDPGQRAREVTLEREGVDLGGEQASASSRPRERAPPAGTTARAPPPAYRSRSVALVPALTSAGLPAPITCQAPPRRCSAPTIFSTEVSSTTSESTWTESMVTPSTLVSR